MAKEANRSAMHGIRNLHYKLSFFLTTALSTVAASVAAAPVAAGDIVPDQRSAGVSNAGGGTPQEAGMSEDISIEGMVVHVTDVNIDPAWRFADCAAIKSGSARLYRATGNRRNLTVGVNAGHGTEGGQSVKTYCHPDRTPKVTGGTTAAGSIMAVAVSGGMTFKDGTKEAQVTLDAARLLRDRLLAKGYDVLMTRDGDDAQLDNVARTVIANNVADCLISLHWDGDGLGYDKGCFYISVPEGLKKMDPVSGHWREHEKLGAALIEGLRGKGCRIHGNGKAAIDLTQTSYSTIPSVDVELGNQCSAHDVATLSTIAEGLLEGVETFFESARRTAK